MNMNYMNLSLAWMGAFKHGAGSLRLHERDRDGAFRSGGNPVTVFAEISPVTKSGEAIKLG